MSSIAMEAALAEISAWRRDTERKIARLEAEVLQLRANGLVHGGPPTIDLSAATAPGVMPLAPPTPAAAPLKEPIPPWAVHAPIPPLVPAAAPSAPAVALLVSAAHAPAAPPSAPAVAPPPAAVAAPPQVQSVAVAEPPRVISVASRARPVHQYDLDMRPGESVELPSGLDGSRRKKWLMWFVLVVILGGMASLIISALASQR